MLQLSNNWNNSFESLKARARTSESVCYKKEPEIMNSAVIHLVSTPYFAQNKIGGKRLATKMNGNLDIAYVIFQNGLRCSIPGDQSIYFCRLAGLTNRYRVLIKYFDPVHPFDPSICFLCTTSHIQRIPLLDLSYLRHSQVHTGLFMRLCQ